MWMKHMIHTMQDPWHLCFFALLLPMVAYSHKLDPTMLRTYFSCPPCEDATCQSSLTCMEVVKEPGVCSCCFICAKQEGDMCSPFTDRCGQGLRCLTLGAPSKNLEEFLSGKGICMPKRKDKLGDLLANFNTKPSFTRFH